MCLFYGIIDKSYIKILVDQWKLLVTWSETVPLSPLCPLFLVSCSLVVDVASRSGMDMFDYCQALLELSELPPNPAAPALPDPPLPGPAFPRRRGDSQLELLARELDSAAEECVRTPSMEQQEIFLIPFKNTHTHTHMRFNVRCICFLLSYYSYAQKQFGSNVAAAFYLLNLKGGFRWGGTVFLTIAFLKYFFVCIP